MKEYDVYELWMKSYGRSVPSMDVFATSQFFNAFVRFADYVNRTSLYAPDQFVKLMKEYDVSPTLWLNAELYDIYHTWLDLRYNPLEQVQTSVDTIFKLMEIFDSKSATAAIERLNSRELIELLRNRKLSVYLVLCSSVFKNQITKMDEGDRKELGTLLNAEYVSKKFDADKKLHEDIKAIVGSLGI
jgi:hypothetical protein